MAEVLESEYIPINLENVVKNTFDKEQFEEGLGLGSFYAGLCTALFNCGLTEDNVTEIVTGIIDHNMV